MRFSYHKSPIRLWWRRQVFRLRQLSYIWFLFAFVCVLIVIIIIPNPFSAQYSRIPINQGVQWNNVNGILQVKEKILQNDTLSTSIKIVKSGDDEPQSTSTILIVLYTTIFRDKKYCSFSIDQIFGKSCPSKNRCEWSCDHRRYREADALIFHAYDIQFYHASVPTRSETKPNSIWILWSDEPPSMVNYALFKSYHFNWTISYKLNSEVSLAAYGLFSEREDPLLNKEYEQWIENEFFNRTNGALWFVSNCNAKKRLEIYYQLKYASKLSIEGYGRCVDYYPIHLCSSSSQCEYDYMSNFKFYFSFESNTCRDYVTEKFYKAFYYGLIPIVYGPDKNDYERLAPKNSFIHINSFDKDMNKLANYLEKIHTNLTLFSIYHQWRQNYEVIVDGKALERIRMCELCQRLINVRKGEMIYYENIEEFYNEKCDYT